MDQEISALILRSEPDHLSDLKAALEREPVEIQEAKTCEEAARRLQNNHPPHLVFTETTLTDGSWTDVLRLAQGADKPVDVIVLSPQLDPKLYIEVIERGAYDFVAAPFEPSDLAFVVRCAAGNARGRRESLAHAG